MTYVLTDCPPEKIIQGAIKQAPEEVQALQDLVGAKPDGIFGEKTKKAIWDKYGDITNKKVFESLPDDVQKKFAEFDKAIGGSKGYFQQPEVCVVEGVPDLSMPDMQEEKPGQKYLDDKQQSDYGKDRNGLLHSSGPEVVERPMARPPQAEQADKGLFQVSPSDTSAPKALGLAQVDPTPKEIITLENRLGDMAAPEIIKLPHTYDLTAPAQENTFIPVAQGPMGVVAKELPANLSGMAEPSAKADLALSTAMGSAGISDQGMFDKITSAEKSGWSSADGPNTEVAGSWGGKMLSSAFESATSFVKDAAQDAYAALTANIDADPAKRGVQEQAQQQTASFVMRSGL